MPKKLVYLNQEEYDFVQSKEGNWLRRVVQSQLAIYKKKIADAGQEKSEKQDK